MNSLKQKIQNKELTVGSWLTLDSTAVAELMARQGSFDWLTIDLEHSALTIREAQEMIRVVELCAVAPLVRVGCNDPYIIKRVMDAGAHGVIVPMVNSAAEAKAAVEAVRYPPSGRRGVGLARAQGYGFTFESYLAWLEKESVVIAQIEHIQAVENLAEILAVPGIDGTIIGPYDLSGSLGKPGDFANELVEKALQRYETVCGELAKPPGVHIVQPDAGQFRFYRDKGYRFIALSLDTLLLGTQLVSLLEAAGLVQGQTKSEGEGNK